MNNLDSNQRNKEPSQEEKYPQKNIQRHDTQNYVDLHSDQISQGRLAHQLNKQHQAMHYQPPMAQAPDIPQILVSSQPKAFGIQPHLGIVRELFPVFDDMPDLKILFISMTIDIFLRNFHLKF